MSSRLYTSPARQYLPEMEGEGEVVQSREPKESMFANFIVLIRGFKGVDFDAFVKEHERLYLKAKSTGDHGEVTAHYYSVMSAVVEGYYGGSFHFVPPGCGIGTTAGNIARYTGGHVTGITVAPNEVSHGNRLFAQNGLGFLCHLVEGDCNDMNCLEDDSFDSAYAIYALKYFPDLNPVISEVKRVLKPGGLFLIYDLVKTDYYERTKKPEDTRLIEELEFACGMPALHTNPEMSEFGRKQGMEVVCQMDITTDPQLPWFYTFVENPWLVWLLESPFIHFLCRLAEFLRILPKGFAEFNRIFLSGTTAKLVRGGQRRILTGSNVLVLRKLPQTVETQKS